jgi:hypothetical protein
MAQWDSAYCLAECKLLAQRPTTDEQVSDADWYLYLTQGQEYWMGQLVNHCPWTNMTAPTLLTSGDSGYTYPFENDADSVPIVPLAVELYESATGRLLRPGTYHDSGADYVWEGDRIRIPKGGTKTWTDGPYARYVKPPNNITASVEPVLKPKRARKLVVYRAVILWASSGGFRDPQPFRDLEDEAWYGDPMKGKLGLLGELKLQNPFQGVEAIQASDVLLKDLIDDGTGYTPAG